MNYGFTASLLLVKQTEFAHEMGQHYLAVPRQLFWQGGQALMLL